eukprot:gene1331-376_t
MVELGQGPEPEIMVHAIRVHPDWSAQDPNAGGQDFGGAYASGSRDATQNFLNVPGFEDAISLEIDFQSSQEIFDAKWEIKYTVDHNGKRTVVVLGSVEAGMNGTVMDGVDYSMRFDLDRIDPPFDLQAHEGLLVATLVSNQREILDVNVVCQVSVYNGRFVRTFLNPLM